MTIETLQAAKDLEKQLNLVKDDLSHLGMMFGPVDRVANPQQAQYLTVNLDCDGLRVEGLTLAQKQELIKVVTGMLLINQTVLTDGIGAL